MWPRIFAGRLAAAAAVVSLASHARAADSYWLGAGGNDADFPWSDSYNWLGGNVPNNGDTVHLRGALIGAANKNDMTARRFGQVLFEALPGDVSQGWTVNGIVRADLVQNRTRQGQRIERLVADYDSTVDNATPRGDAGALYIGAYAFGSAGPGAAKPVVTFRPGDNGIELGDIYGRGDVVIDGPGYVRYGEGEPPAGPNGLPPDPGSFSGTTTVRRGTLVVADNGISESTQQSPTFVLAAGTTLKFEDLASSGGDSGLSWGTYSGLARIRATAGRATMSSGAQNGSPTFAQYEGAFRKAGSGLLVMGVAQAAEQDWNVEQGGLAALRLFDPDATGPGLTLSSLTVAAGATFDAVGSFVEVKRIGGSGAITVRNTNFINSEVFGILRFAPADAQQLDATVAGNGRLVKAGAGSLEVRALNTFSGGTTVEAGKLIVTSPVGGLGGGPVSVTGGTLAGTGRVSGAVTIGAGGTIAPSRLDTPGLNTGTLTVRSLAFAAGGTAEIEFNGIDAGTQVDQIAVGTSNTPGAANLTGGRLSLRRGSNFFPASGKFPRVPIVVAGSITGVFASVGGVRVNDTYSFAVTYDGKSVYAQLADVSDTNLDNVQDYRDLFALAGQYKKGTTNQTWTSGDLSGDGTVNYTDLLLANSYVPVLTNAQFATLKTLNYQQWYDYGQLNGFAVPEPATLAALSLGAAALGRRRRRR